MIPRRWSNALLWLVHVCIVILIALQTNHVIPEPYMDEIFHVGQAQTYCRGQWTTWDPKLTTPPGLYLPSAVLGYFLHLPTCSIASLRAVNALLVAVLPLLLADLLATLRHQGSAGRTQHAKDQAFKEALCIGSFPLVYFFGFLYYTDVASLTMVLLAYRSALAEAYVSSAAIGLASLLFRQTNILWIAYIAFKALDRRLQRVPPDIGSTSALEKTHSLELMTLADVPLAAVKLLQHALQNPHVTLGVLLPYVPVAGAFAAFLRWNGGIVLGDKTMHVAVLHVPQIYYFTAFAAAMAAPVLLLEPRFLSSTVRATFGAPFRIGVFGSASAVVAWTIKHYTIAHPFLLADNRHYPFYIWRRLINVHPVARYALAPAYVLSGILLFRGIPRSRTWTLLPVLAFVAVTALTLVPSPLIEFRYFIVPYVLLRLHLRPSRRVQILAEAATYAAVNAVTLAVFWWRPFEWPQEPGRRQRFMW